MVNDKKQTGAKLILIVDDEARMRRFMRMNLELEGYRVIEAEDGMEAIDRVREDLPALAVMDVMMPQIDGFEALRLIREVSNVPVIMLTVRAEEDDVIKGLDLGADDYITKPFSPRVLAGRIRSALRRAEIAMPTTDKNIIVIDDYLQIDLNKRQAIVNGQAVKLRPLEFKLLYHLVSNPGWTIPHESLLAKVWGHEYHDETNYLRLYVTYLRQKIEADPAHPKYIFTERGVGYRFVNYKRKTQ